jgi:ribosomal protein L7/L12
MPEEGRVMNNYDRIYQLEQEANDARLDVAFQARLLRSSFEKNQEQVEEISRLERQVRDQVQDFDAYREEQNRQRRYNTTVDDLGNILQQDGFGNFKLVPFLIGGEKITTIKAVRILTGLGLKEAKDIVDSWFAPGAVFGDPIPPATKPSGLHEANHGQGV